ncbi:MAG: TetR/AcrR family transcriptional regulator [Pseudomonadota bacterium]
MAKRLKKADWIGAGLDALADDGFGALAAEPMCRRIGTSKGSFYWHFNDLPDFHQALVAAWQETALEKLAQTVSLEKAVDHRLRAFGRAMLADRSETAIRVWARANPTVETALSEVDAQRLSYLKLLLKEAGLANPDFAHALLAALIGLPQLHGPDGMAIRTSYDALIDTVMALSD